MQFVSNTVLVALMAVVFSVAGYAEGDAVKGEKVFRKCKACHSFDPKARKMGPTFDGLLGRTSASIEGYRYSKAFKATDFIWDEEKFSEFIQAPKKMVKGNRMPFGGLRKPADIENLIAFLKTKAK